jgi:nucleoside 2-deoxyribosyltransferase
MSAKFESQQFFAFVLMPFHNSFDDIYQLGIKETAQELGFVAERVDEQIYQDSMLGRIYRQIDIADVIIADMTGKNPNVFYEVGYAHAKGKLCILLTADANDIPFDLKHHRHIVYNGSATKLRKALTTDLQWAKTELQGLRDSRIKVELQKPFGLLEKSDWIAEGEIDIKIDLLNSSSHVSPDIEALYLYCKKGWVVTQDGKTCPTAPSDLQPFGERHFLSSPVRRLQKGGWAQVTLSMKRVLARATKGEEIKDSYRIRGKIALRIATSSGDFDNELSVDVVVDEIPF